MAAGPLPQSQRTRRRPALDDAVPIRRQPRRPHHTWHHGAGFTIHSARPAPLIRPLAYWIFMAATATVYALLGLAGNHTVVPALALAVALFALARAAQKLTLQVGSATTTPALPAPRPPAAALAPSWPTRSPLRPPPTANSAPRQPAPQPGRTGQAEPDPPARQDRRSPEEDQPR